MKELLLFLSGAVVGNMIGIATMALAIASKPANKKSSIKWVFLSNEFYGTQIRPS